MEVREINIGMKQEFTLLNPVSMTLGISVSESRFDFQSPFRLVFT